MKPRFKVFTVSLAGLPLAGLALFTDWRFFWRALSYPEAEVTDVNWYQPRSPVRGQPGPPLPVSQASAIPAATLAQVATLAQAHNSKALIVLHRNQIVLEKYWQGYSATAVSNSMSMSKSLVGLLIGIAIEEGHLSSTQDRVADYLPEWANDSRGDLTLADLLYMHSGLRNEDRTDSPFSDLVHLYLSSDADRTALQIPQEMPPGQRYDYNNVNSQILSLVLERATGESYANYLSSRLWQPLQASEASLWLDRPGGHAKPFCCFFATAQDWARVGQMLLHRGKVGSTQVVPEGWLAQMLIPSPLEPTYGLHIWLKARTADYPNVDQAATAPFLAADTFYLDGRGQQRVYILPSYDLVIVRIGEQPAVWDDAAIPNLLVQSLRAAP